MPGASGRRGSSEGGGAPALHADVAGGVCLLKGVLGPTGWTKCPVAGRNKAIRLSFRPRLRSPETWFPPAAPWEVLKPAKQAAKQTPPGKSGLKGKLR